MGDVASLEEGGGLSPQNHAQHLLRNWVIPELGKKRKLRQQLSFIYTKVSSPCHLSLRMSLGPKQSSFQILPLSLFPVSISNFIPLLLLT